jgi:hypothetical protein
MRKFLILAGLAIALVAGCEFSVVERYRYRLIVEVEADGQIKSGAGVIQVVHRPDIVPGRGFKYQSTFSGQAVFVDLGQRGNLIATLEPSNSFTYAFFPMAAFFHNPVSGSPEEQRDRYVRLKILSAQRAKAELPPQHIPMLVTFRNLSNPKSVEQVDPADLAATFGAGVRLKAVWVEMADARVTDDLEKTLPWLPDIAAKKVALDGGPTSSGRGTLASRLDAGSFQFLGFR